MGEKHFLGVVKTECHVSTSKFWVKKTVSIILYFLRTSCENFPLVLSKTNFTCRSLNLEQNSFPNNFVVSWDFVRKFSNGFLKTELHVSSRKHPAKKFREISEFSGLQAKNFQPVLSKLHHTFLGENFDQKKLCPAYAVGILGSHRTNIFVLKMIPSLRYNYWLDDARACILFEYVCLNAVLYHLSILLRVGWRLRNRYGFFSYFAADFSRP